MSLSPGTSPPLSLCCCCSVAKSCPTLRDPMDRRHQAALSFALSRALLQLQRTESVTPSNRLLLCRPLLLLLSAFPSVGVFPSEFSPYIVLGHVAFSSHLQRGKGVQATSRTSARTPGRRGRRVTRNKSRPLWGRVGAGRRASLEEQLGQP